MTGMSPPPITTHIPMMVNIRMQNPFQIGFDLNLSQLVVAWVGFHAGSNHLLF